MDQTLPDDAAANQSAWTPNGRPEPSQRRSAQSLTRMVKAARAVMLARKSEDFTLQEVSARGKVSIGSIYHRFESKDGLVRAVLLAELEKLDTTERGMVDRLMATCPSLDAYVPAYVAGFAEILRDNAVMIGLAMRRSGTDARMSSLGNRRASDSAHVATAALLRFAHEIEGDAAAKAATVFRMIFATVSRRVILDRDDSPECDDWESFVGELSWMSLIYLKSARPGGGGAP